MKFAYKIPTDMHQVQLSLEAEDLFDQWAKEHLRRRHFNQFIPYREALESFRRATGHRISSLKFKRGLTNWCARKGYTLDPREHQNASGRIIRKREVALGVFVAAEMLFIKTN